ncbi:MAG: TonB-dependent receptor plug domain-containing protein [Bacteroidia bacterium]|nr:TonB-dependent receptor plug domain-containing protein [Bacteroidia bacterium]
MYRIIFFSFFLLATTASAQNKSADSILNILVGQQLCFRTADKELQKLADSYRLKINYNAERLSKYSLDFNFHNDRVSYILQSICKTTKSRYFIAPDNTIYIVGRYEKFTPEVVKAIQQTERIETSRTVFEQPKLFNITVSGKVTDISSGEPLPNVSVLVEGARGGTNSNVDGYFTLYNVPSDTAILEFSNVGYSVSRLFLSPKKSHDSLQVQMVSAKNELTEVVVTGKRQQSFKLNQKVSMIKLTPALIATLPSVGEKDIFRSFQLMPGVSAANENTSGLYVRGGTPDQSLVLYDGFTVYNVEHLFGFFSAFNSNAIKDVSLYKGGFEAKYGGRLSSVVDINSKEGDKKKFNAGADLSLMSMNVFGEGPIAKNLTGIINFRKSFRTSLYNKIFDKYSGEQGSESANTDAPANPFGNSNQKTKSFFYDFNARLTWKPTVKMC